MIQEEYVNEETMNLLLEKDYWQDCDAYYTHYVPTQSQVMKWLREVHKYLIVIGNKNENYLYLIKDLKSNTDLGISNNEYIRYEEACEAYLHDTDKEYDGKYKTW